MVQVKKKKKKLKKRTYDKPGLHPVTWPQDARLAMVSLASPPPPQTSHLTDKHDGGRFYKVLWDQLPVGELLYLPQDYELPERLIGPGVKQVHLPEGKSLWDFLTVHHGRGLALGDSWKGGVCSCPGRGLRWMTSHRPVASPACSRPPVTCPLLPCPLLKALPPNCSPHCTSEAPELLGLRSLSILPPEASSSWIPH